MLLQAAQTVLIAAPQLKLLSELKPQKGGHLHKINTTQRPSLLFPWLQPTHNKITIIINLTNFNPANKETVENISILNSWKTPLQRVAAKDDVMSTPAPFCIFIVSKNDILFPVTSQGDSVTLYKTFMLFWRESESRKGQREDVSWSVLSSHTPVLPPAQPAITHPLIRFAERGAHAGLLFRRPWTRQTGVRLWSPSSDGRLK